MKQIYVEGWYGNGYSRFMRYVNNVINHPKREAIERRVEIIEFFDEFGADATKKASAKAAPLSTSGNRS